MQPSPTSSQPNQVCAIINWPEPLWAEAVRELQREKPDVYRDLDAILRENLEGDRGGPPDLERLAGDVLDVARSEKEKTRQSLSSDRRRIFHDVIGHAKTMLDRAKPLLDLDPTGYAKLMCIPLTLALSLVTRSHEAYEDAFGAFSFISPLLRRYEEREREREITRNIKQDAKPVLKNSKASSGTICRSPLQQVLRSSIIDIDDWKSRINVIKEKDEECQILFRIIDSRITRDIHDRIKNFDDARGLSGTLQHLHTSEHDYLSDYRNIISRLSKTPGTGSWIFENAQFLNWNTLLDHGLRILWLHGPVGCGKTTLTTRVIERFLEVFENNNHQVAYFYCSKTQSSGSQSPEVLASIKRFLDQNGLNENPRKLTLQECEDLLDKIFGITDQITIIIDALDECADPRELLEIFQNFEEKLRNRTSPAIKVFLSSRDEAKVLDQLYPDLCEELVLKPEDTAEDLRIFIDTSIGDAIKKSRSHPLRRDGNLKRDITSALIDHGKGAFKWTQLHLALISDFCNEDDI
ncbi:hypothetical protein F4774DRAFT_425475 [Daldinia eschscholtzii]|nr:hypothetical protein F4774DRAFT_425475 [Daldinia eschscholtzii]